MGGGIFYLLFPGVWDGPQIRLVYAWVVFHCRCGVVRPGTRCKILMKGRVVGCRILGLVPALGSCGRGERRRG